MLPFVFVVLVAVSVIGIRLARRALLLRRQGRSVLPFSHHRLSKPGTQRWGWSFERSSARLWITAWNDLPEVFIKRLGVKLSKGLKNFYSLGVWVALLASAIAAGGLALATIDIWLGIVSSSFTGDARDATSVKSGGARPLLEPIIPGITRPLSHLPTLLLALLVNQGIHEVGHALSAAIDGLPPAQVSLGVLGYIMPMASVSFHEEDLNELDRKASMRLAAAGPLHNLATWIVVTLALSTSLTSLYVEDVTLRGLYVQSIRQGSELANYLPDFAVINRVGPIGLAEVDGLNIWDQYLTRPNDLTRLSWEDLQDPTHRDVIHWDGDRSSLRNDLVLSSHAPRQPRWLCRSVFLYWEYFVGMALSLALFNLLPFPGSDGSQLFSAALAVEHEDLESGRMRMHLGHRVRYVKVLEWSTIAFGAAFGLGQVVHSLVS